MASRKPERDSAPEVKAEPSREPTRARAADRETGWFRTAGGMILEMDLPLSDNVAGSVTRVAGPDGGTYEGQDDKAPDATMDAAQAALDLADLAKYLHASEYATHQEGQSDFGAMVAAVDAGVAGPFAAQVAMRILREREGVMGDLSARLREAEADASAAPDAPKRRT